MASRRMLSKSISVSKQVNSLSLFSSCFFTWTIPHADDFGRISGDPDVLRATVLPMMKTVPLYPDGPTAEITPDLIRMAIAEIAHAKLWVYYEADNEPWIAFPKWEDHQGNLHKRTKSKIPEPPKHSGKLPEIPGTSGRDYEKKTDSDLNSGKFRETPGNSGSHARGRELNLTKEKGTQPPPTPSNQNPGADVDEDEDNAEFGLEEGTPLRTFCDAIGADSSNFDERYRLTFKTYHSRFGMCLDEACELAMSELFESPEKAVRWIYKTAKTLKATETTEETPAEVAEREECLRRTNEQVERESAEHKAEIADRRRLGCAVDRLNPDGTRKPAAQVLREYREADKRYQKIKGKEREAGCE